MIKLTRQCRYCDAGITKELPREYQGRQGVVFHRLTVKDAEVAGLPAHIIKSYANNLDELLVECGHTEQVPLVAVSMVPDDAETSVKTDWNRPTSVSQEEIETLGETTLNSLRSYCGRRGVGYDKAKHFAQRIEECLQDVKRTEAIAGAVMFIVSRLVDELDDESKKKRVQ